MTLFTTFPPRRKTISSKSGVVLQMTAWNWLIASNASFTNCSRRLGRMPGRGHTKRPVLFFPLYSFLIVYQPDVNPIRIMAVLRGRRNIKRILRERS